MALSDLLDEEFAAAPAETDRRADGAGFEPPARSGLSDLLDAEFGTKPREPEQPGFLSRAAGALGDVAGGVGRAVKAAFSPAPPSEIPGEPATGATLAASGPAIVPGTVASLSTPKPAPGIATPKALGTREGEGIAFPGAPKEPTAPIPFKIKPGSPAMQAAAEAARNAPIAEQMRITPEAQARDLDWRQAEADRREASRAITARPADKGDEERGAIAGAVRKGLVASGALDPAEADARARQAQAASAVLALQAKDEGKTVSEIREPGPRLIGQAALGAADPLTLGMGRTVLRAYGFQEDMPETPAEHLSRGAGQLGGFILMPAKIAHRALEGNVLKWLAPTEPGLAVARPLAEFTKLIARDIATLSVASTLAAGGDIAEAPTMTEALKVAGSHAASGALLGSVFGGVGGAIPGNALFPRAARLGVGLAAIDLAMGTRIHDDRALSQKAFDYGLNIFFLFNGKDPRAINALLTRGAKERTEEARSKASDPDAVKAFTPEQVLKSVLDKAMERAAKAPSSEVTTEAGRRSVLVNALRSSFAEEVGDVATGTTASELRSARQVAEEKTGGPVPEREAAAQAPATTVMILPAGQNLGRPVARPAAAPPLPPISLLGQPRQPVGPIRLFGPAGRPVEVPGPTAPPEAPVPLRMAQELAGARAEAIRTAPATGAQPGPVQRQTVPTGARSENFRAFAESLGKRWPLTARDPDYARLRFEFDEFRKGLYEARRGEGGTWAVVNRMTGEEVDHLPGGAKAQLESNRLNAVVTLDSWRQAQVPAPIRMVLPQPAAPARPVDLSTKPAPEPKLEAGTPAATELAREKEIVKPGPPLTAEPPAEAPIPTPPAPPPVAVGREQEVRVPAGNRYKTRYEIVEAKDLIPSHNPQTFAKDPRYPEGVQNRPYHSDKSEQAKVIRQGQDFEPLFLVSPQPSSGGTPIVASDSNIILSGNSRTMSLLRTLGTPAFERYKTALKEMAPALGLKPEDVDRAQQPVLVRRPLGTDTTPESHRRIAAEMNQGFKQALNTQAAAVSQGAAMKPETMEWIAGQVDALGENGSLRDFLRSGKDRDLIQRLIQDGVFTDRELNKYIDTRTTQLNEDGKRLVERAILGNAIPDPDLLAQAPDSIVAKIERSLGAIARVKGRGGEWDLGKDLVDAVKTVVETKAMQAGSVEALRRQGSLLEQAGPTSRADTLADALIRMKPNDFKAAIGRYADEAQRDVRGQETLGFAKPMGPDEAFRSAFGGGPERVMRVAEEKPPYRAAGEAESSSPSGPRPTEASRSGEAEGEFMKSPMLAPPSRQAEPSQVSRVAAPRESKEQRETAPSFQIMPPTPAILFTSEPSLTQATANVQGLLRLAGRSQPGFEAALKDIAARIPGAAFLSARVKDEGSVINKMQRKAPKGPETFDDYLAGRIQADKPDTLARVADAIRTRYPERLEDNFVENPNSWGYRGDHFSVKLPTGLVAEIQLVPEPIADYQAGRGHDIYERWRSETGTMTDADLQQRLADQAESRARYQEAYDRWAGKATETGGGGGGREPVVEYRLDTPVHPAVPRADEAPPADYDLPPVTPPRGRRHAPPSKDLTDLFAISGGSGPGEGGGRVVEAPPLATAIRKNLLEYGRSVFEEGPRSFPSWARRMREDIGPGVAPHLPDAWSELLREMARTQGKKAVAAVEAERATSAPRQTARRAESAVEKPLEPPPALSDPQMKFGLSKQVVDAAEDLFLKAGVKRDTKILLADQVMGMLRTGQIKVPAMAEALRARGLSFTDFGASLYRENVRDAARELGALGRLARAIKAAADEGAISKGELADLRRAEPELDEHLQALSWWRRADNARRGLLVTQLATAMRNFESQIGRVSLDTMDQALQGFLQRRFGKTQTQSASAALGELASIFQQMTPAGYKAKKARVDAIVEAFPKETSRLFATYSADIAVAARRDGAAGKIDRAFDGVDKAVDVLNWANRLQEFVVRRGVFEGELAQALRAKGQDLDAIVLGNRLGEIDAESLKTAVQKSLEVTFAETPAYGSLGHHFIQTVNKLPGATLAIPFPRFMVNSFKFLFSSFNPLGIYRLALPSEWAAARRGDPRGISRGLIGTGMLLAGWAMQELFNDDGAWYEVQMPGMDRAIDTRAFNPYSGYLFLGDLLKRSRNGTLGRMSGGDILKGLLSFDPSLRVGSYTLDKLISTVWEGKKGGWQDALSSVLGNIAAGVLMPTQTLTDVLAFFDPELAVVRETSKETFLGPVKAKIPWVNTGAEPVYSTTNAEPRHRESPLLRQLTGITLTPQKNDFERELNRLAFSFAEIRGPGTGDRTLDNAIAGATGQMVEEAADRIASARYQNASDPQKALMLRDWLKMIRARARQVARREDPQRWREVMEEKRPWRERAEIEAAEEEGRRPVGVRRR